MDSILIDEARTPLIISGGGTCSADTYRSFAAAMLPLKEGVDYVLDEGQRLVMATEVGIAKVEEVLGMENIYADETGALANHLKQALHAQFLFRRDVDYVVLADEIKLVDAFTGRIMEGRRFSDGLHQAIEAKEGLPVREESQALASITLQNYFRLYGKLSGMTGTAATEEVEFRQIYKLPVVTIPTNRPVARKDEDDLVFATAEAKLDAVVADVAERSAKGQPCLVGTTSIESSERLSRLLTERAAILEGKDVRESVPSVINDAVCAVVAKNCSKAREPWNVSAVEAWAANMTGRGGFKLDQVNHGDDPAKVAAALASFLQEAYGQKESQIGPALMAGLAQNVMMRAIDMRWMMHLREMDCLKAGVGLRAVGKRDPLVEYKEEAYAAFGRMTAAMYEDFLRILLRSKLTLEVKVAQSAA